MNTCKTCICHGTRKYLGGSNCTNHKMRENDRHVGVKKTFEKDALVYEYYEGGDFWTGEDFGCIHHKELK